MSAPQPVSEQVQALPHHPANASQPQAQTAPATRLEAPPSYTPKASPVADAAFPRAVSPLADAVASPRIRPEPRELPERTSDGGRSPLTPRKTTEDEALRRYPVDNHGRRVRRSGGERAPLVRYLVPLGFVAVLLGVIFTVVLASRPHRPHKPLVDPDDEEGRTGLKPPAAQVAGAASPSGAKPPAAQIPAPGPATILPVQDPQELPVAPPPTIPPANIEAALEAEKTLELFLDATDAETRAALCEPATKAASLVGTPLAGRLPERLAIDAESKREVPEQGYVEYPFDVTLKKDGMAVEYYFVVRKHGDLPPQVYLPSAMDLLGGRLAKFSAAPSKDVETFHVVLEAVHGCYDTKVPNRERKHTFHLRPGPAKEVIASAYFREGSRYEDMLRDPASEFHWGTRRRATVTLQWNRTEDPNQPFLEVTEIKSFDWDS